MPVILLVISLALQSLPCHYYSCSSYNTLAIFILSNPPRFSHLSDNHEQSTAAADTNPTRPQSWNLTPNDGSPSRKPVHPGIEPELRALRSSQQTVRLDGTSCYWRGCSDRLPPSQLCEMWTRPALHEAAGTTVRPGPRSRLVLRAETGLSSEFLLHPTHLLFMYACNKKCMRIFP